MYKAVRILLFTLLFVFTVNAQKSMQEALLPGGEDLAAAQNEGLQAFKLLPRGMFDIEKNELNLRGGGAYYSFVKKSHSYNETPQIQLEKNNLSVSFYGANYGFIADLGKTPLAAIDREKTKFLVEYKPTNDEPTARAEYRKIRDGFEVEGVKYKQTLPAVVGHTYLLRAISFNEADTLVAFQIHRKESDGSLIIFWKLLENFEKPVLNTQKQTAEISLQEKILRALKSKGYYNVTVDVSTIPITLRGTIPKGKMAEAVQTAMEAAEKPLINELIEK